MTIRIYESRRGYSSGVVTPVSSTYKSSNNLPDLTYKREQVYSSGDEALMLDPQDLESSR